MVSIMDELERTKETKLEKVMKGLILISIRVECMKQRIRAAYYSISRIDYHWADDPFFPDYVVRHKR